MIDQFRSQWHLGPMSNAQGSSNRSFGLVFAIAFLAFGLWPFIRYATEQPPRFWALAVSAGFALAALIYPTILGPLNKMWMKFGFLMQKVTTPIVMGAMFYLLITPIALFFRLTKRDALNRRFDRNAETYWIGRLDGSMTKERLRQQF